MINHSLYVFEGVDGTGKTTLAKAFAQKINGQYYKGLPKRLKPFKNFVDKSMPAKIRYLFYSLGNKIVYKEVAELLKFQDVVVDQYVYCTVAFHTVSLNKKLKKTSPKIVPEKIIYLTASWDEIDKRLNERGGRKKLEDLDYLKNVDLAYREILKDLPNVTYLNTEGKSIEENIKEIIE
jgi:deoxyguanosine kinase